LKKVIAKIKKNMIFYLKFAWQNMNALNLESAYGYFVIFLLGFQLRHGNYSSYIYDFNKLKARNRPD
jgi:hypothetical protein